MTSFLSEVKILQVDAKGNLAPMEFELNKDLFYLAIKKYDALSPASPLTPLSPLSSSSPLSPLSSEGSKRRSFRIFRFMSRSSSSSSDTRGSSLHVHRFSGTPSSNSDKLVIRLSQIQDLRTANFDHKIVNPQSLKKIKSSLFYGKRCDHVFKLLVISYGMEFNLKKLTFLIVEPTEPDCSQPQVKRGSSRRRKPTGILEQRIAVVRELILTCTSLTYFSHLKMWYKKEFAVTTYKSTDNHRLKIWKQFLTRNTCRIQTQALGTIYDGLENLLQSHDPEWCLGTLSRAEFEMTARYFLHSPQTISSIFESSPATSDDGNIFRILETCDDAQLKSHRSVSNLMEIVSSYLNYLGHISTCLPPMTPGLDSAAPYTKALIRKLVDRVRKDENELVFQEHWLSSNYILDYMFSEDNSIWDPVCSQVNHEMMNRPLSHYWIASSHNTYLTGDQYSSPSSIGAYARVLRQGCRCIEIDVWNGPWNKPIVKHGRTLTSAIRLKDVLIAIKENAFITSCYPVIISVENHCNIRQQKVMAKYFLRIFGPMLLTSLLDRSTEGHSSKANPATPLIKLPSPNQLKNRILLKGRKLPSHLFDGSSSPTGSDQLMVSYDLDGGSSGSTGLPRGSTFFSDYYPYTNPCDCLITGELWQSNNFGRWRPCIFVLTNRKLFYIEKRVDDDGSRELPNLLSGSGTSVRNSMSSQSSQEPGQDLHTDQPWFYGRMPGGRVTATTILERCGVDGTFLVRESDTKAGCTLSFFFSGSNKVYHCHIHTKLTNENELFYSLKNDPKPGEIFPSIFELIEHYKGNPLVTNDCVLDRLTQPIPPSTTHETQEWFYKDMDRVGAEKVLEKLPINGAFLGRYRTNDRSAIVISFRFDNVIKHSSLRLEGRYLTVSRLRFPKLETLVEHYGRNPFYKDIKLSTPVGNDLYKQSQQSDCIQRVYACADYLNTTVKTVKGRVRAIQSYNTEDPELLSFRKGDVIVNVVKETDGWWWGTKEDANEDAIPKLFCASFVEEIEELESPFGDLLCKGQVSLGIGVTVKPCNNREVKDQGIKHYLSFRDHDKKWKLGAACSKRKVHEWADLINYVVDRDPEGQRILAKIQAGEKYNIAPEYSDLIVYFCAVDRLNPNEIGLDKANINVTGLKSLDEVAGDRLFRSNPSYFVWYHQYAITRVYPKGLRLDSSNLPSPVRLWNFGCQMVALNYQTPDKAMQWNRGKFRQNGNCGYVLKPNFMISETQDRSQLQFDPTQVGDSAWQETLLKIQILSARHLERSGSASISPLVEIEVIGVDADCRKVKTLPVDNGLNPCWNHEVEIKVRCPDLALIQFSVCDVDTFSDRVLLGEQTIPVKCVREGYRSVQLRNAHGEPLFSTLLVKIEKQVVSPTGE